MRPNQLVRDEGAQVVVVEQLDVFSSCEVRKPSKKCRNGMRDSSVAAWATRARSWASWTEAEASSANPVWRAAMTSAWSPKIERPCAASERAATWKTAGVSSPAILYMLGIISSRPCDAVNVVVEGAALERAVQRARGPALALHLHHHGHGAPQVAPPLAGPLVGELGHRRGRRDRVDAADLVQPVGDRDRRLVAVDRDAHQRGLRHHLDGVHRALVEARAAAGTAVVVEAVAAARRRA